MRTSRRTAAGLLGALALGITALPAHAYTTGYGHTSSAERTLRHGCHRYRYHYVAEPGSDDWLLEIRLVDPRGKQLASADLVPGADPVAGFGHFRICRATTRAGRFTIHARLDWYVPPSSPLGQPEKHTVWFKPAHFRLRNP